MIEVPGSPIGGENPPHDRRWREQVAAAAAGCAPATAVMLQFRLEPGRRVDLDNLVRPVLAGLRDAAVFTRGFTDLVALRATKSVGSPAGLIVEFGDQALGPPTDATWSPLLSVSADRLPTDGDAEAKAQWRDEVRRSWTRDPVDGPVWLEIDVRTGRSLEGLMKPIIDGLEPFLGRDPRGRLAFVPNDHLVTWLTIRRTLNLPSELRLRAGTLPG